MADNIVNEKSDSVITATFKDEDGNLITPASGTYRIDDLASGTEIKADTAFSPTSSSHTFLISSNENRILATANAIEKRIFTVTFVYGAKQGTNEFVYIIKNLFKIT